MERNPSFSVRAFGSYYLLDRIAVGGMAEIFKAKQSGVRGFEKILVIKKILQGLSDDPEFVEMFEDEAKIAAQLNHANIVQIYELGEIENTLYITMEFVEGKNLRDVTRAILGKGLHLSIPQSIYIISEVLKGLDYAHRKKDSQGVPLQIIHRDMSPQNIVLSYEGEVKILDFGIAKAASKISKTEAGVLKGKFSYMSPEQASGRPIDQTTDIYACGVILHELLSSERLFRAETDMETIERVKQANVHPPSEKNSSIPKELDGVVLNALQRSPEKRYQTAGEMLSDLVQVAQHQNFALNSQELSAFLRTLFSESIKLERKLLKQSLAQIPQSPLDQLNAAKTHIAFKAKDFPSTEDARPENSEDKRDATIPGGKVHQKKRVSNVTIGALFIGALIFYLWTSQKPAPSDNAIAHKTETKQSPKSRPKKQPPTKTTNQETNQTSKEIENYFSKIEPSDSSEKPGPRPQKTDKAVDSAIPYGTIDMIAPPEGYAQLYINKKSIGTVPGPKARGIRLPIGRHHIRCVTAERSYEGYIYIQGNESLTIKCSDLAKNP